jgi:hypothetical protein
MSELEVPVGQNEEELTPADPLTVSRRWLLLKVGALFNGVVGAAFLVPIFKYLRSPVKPDNAYQSWVSLGSVDTCPVGETTLAKVTNLVSWAWDDEADVANTGLSASLCFSGRLLDPSYAPVDRPLGLDALKNQIAAGAFTWVFGSLVFLIPANHLTARSLANGRLINEKTGLERARAMAQ